MGRGGGGSFLHHRAHDDHVALFHGAKPRSTFRRGALTILPADEKYFIMFLRPTRVVVDVRG